MFGFKKLKRYLRDPKFALGCDLIQKYPNWMSDKFYIETEWRIVMGYKLDLKNPKTFNEKLQWLKLNYRNPLQTILVDKIAMKEWMLDKLGIEYIIPTLQIFESVDDIDLDKLPNQFVLKCNHDSGSVVICRDKSNFDLISAKNKLSRSLCLNFFDQHREWPYKHVSPKVFAETFLDLEISNQIEKGRKKEMIDYKFYCFNGEPRFLYVSQGLEHQDTACINYLDLSYSLCPFQRLDFVPFKELPPKPSCFDDLVELSKKLSSGSPLYV